VTDSAQPASSPPGERGLPVDWDLASRTAGRLVQPGPDATPGEAAELVRRLRADAAVAERHVREITGLGYGLPLLPADVVDRKAWAAAAVSGMAALTAGAELPAVSRVTRSVTARTAGLQIGSVVAYLGGRVLGQYDPFGGDPQGGRLLLVAPNIMAAQRALDVPAEDFQMWVCLHECTHRLQFTGVPWLREYFAAQVAELLAVMDASSGSLTKVPDMVRELRRRAKAADGPLGLVELFQSAEQKVVLDRLVALSTLLEGHADHVMDAVGPTVVPSVATIRDRFSERRKGGGVLDRALRTLLGVEAKVRQYAEGAAFTGAVVDAVGMAGFNAVWTSPETLPTRAEIADPTGWLRRVAP